MTECDITGVFIIHGNLKDNSEMLLTDLSVPT